MIWFWELQERPEQVNSPTPLDLAERFHETYERLAPDFGYTTRPETRRFDPDSPNGRLMIAVCGEVLKHLSCGDHSGKAPSAAVRSLTSPDFRNLHRI